MGLRIGVDVGGTFTDLTARDQGSGRTFALKLRSTPHAPEEAIVEGTRQMFATAGLSGSDVTFFGHGTTVVTNMILEQKGAQCALVTTKGFRDVLELARQARPHVYDYTIHRPPPLVERRHRYEVEERIAADGNVLCPLNLTAVEGIAREIDAAGLDAVAVCFLHAYQNAAHEIAAANAIQNALPGIFVTTSHQVAPEYREYERFATTAMNAFVGPRAARYFAALSDGLKALGIGCPAYTVTSNAGLIDSTAARSVPVRTGLSGPAAGVSGIGRLLSGQGFGDAITFDVGGTSTDIAIVRDGRAERVRTRELGGYPVLAPMVDIATIGAGGSSLARIDAGGALTVGPESAGAVPGPVAYGDGGTVPTVTDAALVLGRLDSGAAIGGLRLDRGAAATAIDETIATPLGLPAEEAAAAIIAVAAAHMARAIRSAVTARGLALDALSLVAYGGAGPLIATDVAEALGLTAVIVPPQPGTLCARALLVSDIARDHSVTRIRAVTDDTWPMVLSDFEAMANEGSDWLATQSIPPAKRQAERVVEARYAGQSFEIAIPLDPGDGPDALCERFHDAHRREQGFALQERTVEAVTLRLKAFATPDGADAPGHGTATIGGETRMERAVWFGDGWENATVLERDAVERGTKVVGPAIIHEATSTIVIPPGWRGQALFDGTITISLRDDAT